MKKTSIIFSVLFGLIFVLLTIFALLPYIVSSDIMKSLILQKVNQKLPGHLLIEEWSFRWFDNIESKGIVYSNHEDDILVKAAEIKISKGILGILFAQGQFGTLEIIDPAVYFYSSGSTGGSLPEKTERPIERKKPETKPDVGRNIAFPPLYGQFVITNGAILTVNEHDIEKVIAENLKLILDASSPKSQITYRFSSESHDKNGRVSGDGSLSLSPDDPLNVRKIQTDSNLRIDNWNLKDVSAFLATRSDIPSGSGRLNADVSLKGSVASSLHLLSHLSMAKLELRGGPLGSDTPTVKGLSIDLDATGGVNGVSLKSMTFHSSFGNGSAGGIFDDQGHRRFSGDADVNLAELFTQFPGTLNLRKGAKILEGKMALSVNVERTDKVTLFQSDASIDQLKGISNEKKLSWDKPVQVKARGEILPHGFRLENLTLRSSFLNADGRGDLNNMRMNLSADLHTALIELKKFIQIKEWDGMGKLKMNLHVNKKSENINTAALKVDMNNFILRRNNREILPKQNIRAHLSADMEIGEGLENSKLLQPSLTVQSSLIKGTFTAGSLEWKPSNSLPHVKNLKFDENINLEQLSSLLKNLDLMSGNILLAGHSTVRAGGSLKEDRLVLNETNVDTRRFFYQQEGKSIKEERLTVTTKARVNVNKKSLLLELIEINVQAGKVKIPELAIADWTNIQKDMKTRATANLDLGKLVEGYGDFITLPGKIQISGNCRLNMYLDISDPKVQYIEVRGDISSFKLVSTNFPTISEKKVTLKADISRNPISKHLTIEDLQLDSNALSLSADGNLHQVGSNKVLKAKGTMAADLALLTLYLKKSGKSSIQFTGRKARPFALKLVSKGNRWEDPLKRLDYSWSMHVKSIKAFGLNLSPKDVPVRIVNGTAGVKLVSPTNGGRLSLQPTMDMTREPYVLSLKDNLDILKKVRIDRELTVGMAQLIHPIFENLVKPQGLVGLHMKYFKWPLTEKGAHKALFAGILKLGGIQLNATRSFSELLSVMGSKEQELDIREQTIDFIARNGRIECSPLTLHLDGSPLVIYGTVGFDKTLDYTASIPITRNMVGKDAYRFLKGISIKVPIQGTISHPKIDRGAIEEATGSLIRKALGKKVQQGIQDLFQHLWKGNQEKK